MRLTLERLREVLPEDHAGRERERGPERGGQLEHAVLALGQEGEPPVDVEARQERHDRGDHHDERRDPEATRNEVADGADGDGGDRGAPGPADLGAVDGQQDALAERRRPGPPRPRTRSGAYDANAKAAAARAAPSTVTPASARPAAPGLKLVRPTPSSVADSEPGTDARDDARGVQHGVDQAGAGRDREAGQGVLGGTHDADARPGA